ncbi:uncharacterized protein LOC110442752 [Mizuhopecten yessoensis]|uniref:Tripartite motif-containing 13 n=1 Tax=Mizuhopecten yessoensis TaxID=6573 RepID=A0A210PGN6_MIZYE|nr:uncharacterized protein LOC110442752 [Mizuhopecten yessoensis]OWF35606.1 Tripartite motif-containing 13 [Mizuhopecten yessoensis]
MSRRLAANIKNDHLACPICQETFTDPRRLPCDHTFCFSCLKQLIKASRKNNTIRCPIDRKETHAPFANASDYHWAESFPKDELALSLLQTVQGEGAETTSGIVCREHGGETCGYFCFGCYEFACSECVLESHKQDDCDCRTLKKSKELSKELFKDRKTELDELLKTIDRMEIHGKVHERSLRTSEVRVSDSLHLIAAQIEKFRDSTISKLINMLTQIENVSVTKNKIDQAKMVKEKIKIYRKQVDYVHQKTDVREILTSLQVLRKRIHEFTEDVCSLETSADSVELHLQIHPELVNICQRLGKYSSEIGKLQVTTVQEGLQLYEESQADINGKKISFDVDISGHDASTFECLLELNVSEGNARDDRTKQSSFSDVVLISHSLFGVDQNNMKILRFTDRGEPISSIKLNSAYSISVIPGTDDVVVTQPGCQRVTVLSTHKGLDVKETIPVHQAYYKISAITETKFAVVCENSSSDNREKQKETIKTKGKMATSVPESMSSWFVHVIDRQGHVVLKVSDDTVCKPSVYGPPYIKPLKQLAVTSSGDIVVSVETRDHSFLSCLSQGGKVNWTYEPVGKPEGIFCRDGILFVFLGDSRTLLTMTEDGHLLPRCSIKLQHYQQSGHAIFVGQDIVAVTDLSDSINLFKIDKSNISLRR